MRTPSPPGDEQVAGTLRTFVIEGCASAQLPLRWLGLFAQRDLMPEEFSMVRSGDRIIARIVQSDLDDHASTLLAEKMRMLPETYSVSVEARR